MCGDAWAQAGLYIPRLRGSPPRLLIGYQQAESFGTSYIYARSLDYVTKAIGIICCMYMLCGLKHFLAW